MKRLLTLILSVVPLLVWAQKPSADDEKSIWQTESAWCNAFLRGDAVALAEIEKDGYVLTSSDGVVSSRDADIAEMKAGKNHYSVFEGHEADIRVFGDTAVVTGRTVLKGTEEGKPTEGIFQFTDTLIRHGASWQAVASQESRVSPTAASAVEPLPRDGNWVRRHEDFVALAKKGGVDVLFLGDSITDNWRKADRGLTVWEKEYGSLHAENFGISGDRTQHVLWRMKHGEMDGINPKVVVLMIGTNNTGLERDKLTPRNSNEETVAGVTAIVKGLRAQLPRAKVLLLAIFPRAATPDDPARIQVKQINEQLAKLPDGKNIYYLDIGSKFLEPDGTLTKEIMPDFLHPNTKGYQIWADAIREQLAQLMGKKG